MNFSIEVDREVDGRWIAEVPSLPGVIVYGATQAEAVARAKALALHVIADRIDHGEDAGELVSLTFQAA
jgi:predicted RNase H-like HicB family nuclease